MGLLVFQGYVFLNAGLFHSSHFFGGLDLIPKHHGMCTKGNLRFETEQKGTCTLTGDPIILVKNAELFQLDEIFPRFEILQVILFPKVCCICERKKSTRKNKTQMKSQEGKWFT